MRRFPGLAQHATLISARFSIGGSHRVLVGELQVVLDQGGKQNRHGAKLSPDQGGERATADVEFSLVSPVIFGTNCTLSLLVVNQLLGIGVG